jgi:hypothetical protein
MSGRTLGAIAAALLALLALPAPAVSAPPRLLSATGIRTIAGHEVLVHVTLAARDDDDAAVAAALRAQGARPLTRIQAARYATIGFRWPDARAAQAYNPAGEPVAGAVAALHAAQATWSSVDGAAFRFVDDGLTTRCPSLWCGAGADGHNDVGWASLPCDASSCTLGVTTFSGTPGRRGFDITESDVLLSNDISGLGESWHTDGSHVDIETVMLHEDGHVLGLNHSTDAGAVMYPVVLEVRRELSTGDVAGVTWLYPAAGHAHPFHPVHPDHPVHPTHPPHPLPKVDATALATLPSAAPGGGDMGGWFEALDIDEAGDVSFGTAVSQGAEAAGQAVFTRTAAGALSELTRSGRNAPGGGVMGCCIVGRAGIGEDGTVAFGFAGDPFFADLPGLNTGIYRKAPSSALAAVVIPGATRDPAGSTLRGAMDADVGPAGQVVFGGMIDDDSGLPWTPDLGAGAYAAPPQGPLATIARPGDVIAGATIRHAANPTTSRAGDIGFTALDASPDFCAAALDPFCGTAAYVRPAGAATPTAIARAGAGAPVGAELAPATFTPFAFQGPVVADGDSAVFQGWVQSRFGYSSSIFRRTDAGTKQVVGYLDPLPDGGRVVFHGDYDANRAGTVVFEAALDSDDNADGILDSGVYTSSAGRLSLVARSGSRVQGLGTILATQSPVFLGDFYGGVAINDAGQILFKAMLEDGRGVLLRTGPTR